MGVRRFGEGFLGVLLKNYHLHRSVYPREHRFKDVQMLTAGTHVGVTD